MREKGDTIRRTSGGIPFCFTPYRDTRNAVVVDGRRAISAVASLPPARESVLSISFYTRGISGTLQEINVVQLMTAVITATVARITGVRACSRYDGMLYFVFLFNLILSCRTKLLGTPTFSPTLSGRA